MLDQSDLDGMRGANMRTMTWVQIEARLTLGTREIAGLLSRDDGTIHMALEHGLGDLAKSVVGLDVLLDSLTAVDKSC